MQHSWARVTVGFVLLASVTTAFPADPNLGRDVAANCANCHGTDGRSQGIIPALADELLFGKLVNGGHVTIDVGDDDKLRLTFEESKEPEPVA